MNTTEIYNCWEPASSTYFIGRDRELRTIYQAIANRRGISLVGDLQIGKSSVLYALEEFYRTQGRSVTLLSGLDSAGQSVRHFVEHITRQAVADEPDRAADVLANWAEKQIKMNLPPLLLVDDVESCFQRFPLRFFERLRGMLYKLVPVFASNCELDLIVRQHEYPPVSPLENRLEIIRLGLLSRHAADALAQRSGGVLSAAAQTLLRTWAGCHPYYLHLLGSHLLKAERLGDSHQSALDKVYCHARPHLRQLWRQLSKHERQLLRRACTHSVNHRGLRLRGLLTEEGQVFGEILREWLKQESGYGE